jgi:inhibitor of KinA
MEITPLGDSAVILRVADDVKRAPGKTLSAVREAAQRIEHAQIPGVIECVSAYTTVGIFFDPVAIIDRGAPADGVVPWLSEKIQAALKRPLRRSERTPQRSVEVPISFDPEFALDLDEVAAHAQLSANEVVDLYCGAQYHVACLGFTPGFPYLIGLPKELAMPRRETPRKEIPAGSVAIGGEQTGIYPMASPGGWNVIGRSALKLFDPQKNPPALLQPGDRVRFHVITREEFGRSTS